MYYTDWPGSLINYYKNPSSILEDPTPNSTANFFEIAAGPNPCPHSYCDPPCFEPSELQIKKSEYFASRSNYNTKKTAYDEAVSNGDTTFAKQMGDEMTAARHTMDEASFMVTLHLLLDTATFHQDSLRVWFMLMDTPAAQIQLARDYLADGMTSQAVTTLSQAAQQFSLNNEDANDFSDLSDIVNLIGSKSVYSLDSQTLDYLENYTDGNGLEATVLAQNIKSMYGNHYPPKYQLPIGGGSPSSGANQSKQSPVSNGQTLTAVPNPASDNVVFTIKGEELNGQEKRIIVTELNGKLVWSREMIGDGTPTNVVWDTAAVPNGIYIYRLISKANSLNLSGKIVVQK